MGINMFHPGRDDKTMACPYCKESYALLFVCNECSNPVCIFCGLLEQPDKSRMVSIEPDMEDPPDLEDPHSIGIEGWLETDNPRERFLCITCLPLGIGYSTVKKYLDEV
jgi:hypothetical protein